MQFSNLSAAAILALAAGLIQAAPATDATYPLVISHIMPFGKYNLTYWSDAGSLVSRAPIPCSGSNDVTYSSSHTGNSGICRQLINGLESNSGNVIGNSPRSICLGQGGGNECCVSWSAAVGPIPQGDLFSAANKVFESCGGTAVSGLARNVNLNGNCVTECVSNRADGCS